MGAWDELDQALRDFEDIHLKFRKLSERSGEGRGREMLQLRRDLQSSVVRLREAGVACQPLDPDHALIPEYQRSLSAMRTALALHQAEWPAVMVDQNEVGYQAANAELRGFVTQFVAVARNAMAKLKP